MDKACFIITRFFLFSTLTFAVTGCGSSGSTAANETGSIAAKLVWSTPNAKEPGKSLFKAPDSVTSIKISVYNDSSSTNSNNLITSQVFDPSLGSGTLTGIPAGNARAIKVEGTGIHSGLGLDGVLIYLGTATVDVVTGQTATVPITMEAPATTAYPAAAPSAASFPVTLTASVPATIYYTTNEPATIYYTTNGANPTTSSTHGISPVSLSIAPSVTLKFFAMVRGLYEAVKEKTY